MFSLLFSSALFFFEEERQVSPILKFRNTFSSFVLRQTQVKSFPLDTLIVLVTKPTMGYTTISPNGLTIEGMLRKLSQISVSAKYRFSDYPSSRLLNIGLVLTTR